jgi:hypothetical protein
MSKPPPEREIARIGFVISSSIYDMADGAEGQTLVSVD